LSGRRATAEGRRKLGKRERLAAVRPWELQLVANVLGISGVPVASYPDGGLHGQPVAELTERVRQAIRLHSVDLLLVVAPEAGDADDTAVALAAYAAARQACQWRRTP
jgi:LmbE family N-acetylglucosaminyl deacetylase